MQLLTEDAKLVCKHENGKVANKSRQDLSQDLVTVKERRLLVESDPEGCSISGCPMYGPAVKPCTHTLVVKEGYSGFLRIKGKRVCLDTVSGFTDGTPPGAVRYIVRDPGQQLVSQSA
jgi:hypothetical protein